MNPETLEDIVLRSGGNPTTDILIELDNAIDDEAFRRAAEFVRHLLRNLEGSSAAKALERAVLGPDHSLETDAKTLQVSKQALAQFEKRLRDRIQPC